VHGRSAISPVVLRPQDASRLNTEFLMRNPVYTLNGGRDLTWPRFRRPANG